MKNNDNDLDKYALDTAAQAGIFIVILLFIGMLIISQFI